MLKGRLPKVHIHPSFVLYMALLFALDGAPVLLSVLLSLTVHESAHLFAGILLNNAYERIELTPFGGVISCYAGKSEAKGLRGTMIAAAGPIANYAFVLFVLSVPELFHEDFSKAILSVNLSMLLLNLLPVLPLDGGRIVFSLGYYLFPVSALLSLLRVLGSFLGVLFILLAFYGLTTIGRVNLSLIITGVYIAFLAKTEYHTLLLSNRYTALSEKLYKPGSISPARMYYVDQKVAAVTLLSSLCSRGQSIYIARADEEVVLLDDRAIITMLLNRPNCTIEDIIAQKTRTNDETFC